MKEIGKRVAQILIMLIVTAISACLYTVTMIRDIVMRGDIHNGWTDKMIAWADSL